jgi:cytochrome c oxidase subunit 3
MTGMHALHVLSGIVLLHHVAAGAQEALHAGAALGHRSGAIYWHYVDVVWIFFYPALYLIGTCRGHIAHIERAFWKVATLRVTNCTNDA